MVNVSNGLIVAGSALRVCPLGKPLVLWVKLPEGIDCGKKETVRKDPSTPSAAHCESSRRTSRHVSLHGTDRADQHKPALRSNHAISFLTYSPPFKDNYDVQPRTPSTSINIMAISVSASHDRPDLALKYEEGSERTVSPIAKRSERESNTTPTA